jgi:hypothetical protein
MRSDSQTAAVESEIAHLRGLDLQGLRARWRSLTGRAAPAHVPKALLLRVLAYRVQAAAVGDLDKATTRLLDRIAEEARSGKRVDVPVPDRVGLRPGTVLVREWEGPCHRVMVLAEGFAWNGTTYASLSQVARAITGTRWNGPRSVMLFPASTTNASRAGEVERNVSNGIALSRRGSEGLAGWSGPNAQQLPLPQPFEFGFGNAPGVDPARQASVDHGSDELRCEERQWDGGGDILVAAVMQVVPGTENDGFALPLPDAAKVGN